MPWTKPESNSADSPSTNTINKHIDLIERLIWQVSLELNCVKDDLVRLGLRPSIDDQIPF